MDDPKQALLQAIQDTTDIIESVSMPFPANKKLMLTRQKLIYEVSSRLNRRVYSIEPKEIANVTASLGPVFGIIYISHKTDDFPRQLGLFWRKDTLRMKRIINGYVLAWRQNINIHNIEKSALLPLLIKLGTDDPTVRG